MNTQVTSKDEMQWLRTVADGSNFFPENARGCAKRLLERLAPETSRDAGDAARYRFLRQPNNAIVYAKDRNAWGEGASGHVKYETAEQLDAAIDAARAVVKTTPNTSTGE